MSTIPDWARAHGIPEIQGHIRQFPSDFEVTELLGYEPSGAGEHDYLWVEKTDANTPWVADRLARHAGIRSSDVGFAGMKDRRATTRQWFSVRRPTGAGTDWSAFECQGLHILRLARHARKLRRGALSGNRFRIAIRGVLQSPDVLAERIERIRARGVPNYFGEQRFGRDGNNIDAAGALFSGTRMNRQKRGIVLSAARSYLFNHILEQRVRDGTWERLVPGEVACLDGSNSVFAVADIDETLQERCAAMDVHPGGALWGSGDSPVTGSILTLEKATVAQFAAFRDGLERYMKMSRRHLRLKVRDLEWRFEEQTMWLDFGLSRGGYATAVLREIADVRS